MTAPHLGPGHTVAGNYTIRALLGFTGEAATYHAVSSAGQEVVIKLFDPGLGQRADVMGELERVRSQVAGLPPGGVVAALDGGYDVGTGAPFVVTEYLQIPSLAALVSRGALDAGTVARVLNGLAAVLDQGRAMGLCHLALKPTNIFVGPAPHFQVRVTDFAASVVRRASPTHEAYALCAPWWAPEQLQPAAVLGAATDCFSAALIAFFALTGRSYWRSCQTHPPDLASWQSEVMAERTPVSQRANELGVVVNPIVDAIFARALSVNQADRPQSVSELAAVLASIAGQAAAPAGAQREAAQTMAFPEAGFDFASGAHSAPGAHAASGAHSAPGAQPYGQPAAPAPGMTSQPQIPGQPGPDGASTDGVTPGLPPFPPQKPKKEKESMLPIIIGVIAAVLIGGTGVALLIFGDDKPDGPATVAAGGNKPVPDDGGGGSKAGDTSSSDGGGSADDGDGGGGPDEPPTIKATFRCKPKCDELKVDNEVIDQDGPPVDVVPGKHAVFAKKKGYLNYQKKFDIPADGPFTKEFKLQKIVKGKGVKPRPCDNQFIPCGK